MSRASRCLVAHGLPAQLLVARRRLKRRTSRSPGAFPRSTRPYFTATFFTSLRVQPAAISLLCCPDSVVMLSDTPRVLQAYFRSLRAIWPANSGNPKPSDPWPRPAADRAGPRRSACLVEVRDQGNVLGLPVPALTAPLVPATVRPP